LRPDYPLASFALRRQKQSAARVLSSGFRRRTEPPDCQKRWRPTFMTARRFRLRGTVFLPGRRIPLREPKSLPLGSPWTFDSLSYRGLPSEGEGQPSRGETAPGDCGCADAYEELPQLHTYDVDTEIPPAQSPIGARVRARPCGQSPRRHPNPAQLLPAWPFPTTQCAGFLCNLGLLNGGRERCPIAAWARRRPPPNWAGLEYFIRRAIATAGSMTEASATAAESRRARRAARCSRPRQDPATRC